MQTKATQLRCRYACCMLAVVEIVAVAVVTVIFRHVLQKVIISDGLRRNNDFLAMTKSGEKNVEVPSGWPTSR